MDRGRSALPAALEFRHAGGCRQSPTISESQISQSHNPIDAFILARLEQEKIRPQPAADKETLIRRVTLDLTGLPPTPAEVDAFLADTSAGRLRAGGRAAAALAALRRAHGALLARPGALRRHARAAPRQRTLDVALPRLGRAARSTTTCPSTSSPIWQLAGDLLPEATRDQQIATGFNRCNVTTSEGGSIDEELSSATPWIAPRPPWRSGWGSPPAARCATITSSIPISQKEFYSLYAFFNSAADPPMDGNILLTPPILQARRRPSQQKQLAEFDSEDRRRRRQGFARPSRSSNYTDPATQTPPPPVQTSEVVWFDDAFPGRREGGGGRRADAASSRRTRARSSAASAR